MHAYLDNSEWELQVCGFDRTNPQIYKVTKNKVYGPCEYLFSGPDPIPTFFDENIESLENLPSEDNRKIEHLKHLVIEAIKYENKVNLPDPKTGGDAIYSLILLLNLQFEKSKHNLS